MSCWKALALAGVVIFAVLSARPTEAQQWRRSPSASYYGYFNAFYGGEYLDALKGFQKEARTPIKVSQSLWIDSICYETMCGECYFQMGVFDKALEHYDNALKLYCQFPDWMTKVRFSAIGTASPSSRKAVPWGVSARRSKIGLFKETETLILQGQSIPIKTKGGTASIQQTNSFPVSPQEIVRCTALALRRRATILGPAAPYDPLSSELSTAVARSIAAPNHWSQCWADLERGLAMLAVGRGDQAAALLQRSLLAAGEFDHPLTGVALLELGRLAMLRGEYPAAVKLFEEATYAAANYSDYGVLEEAFRGGATAYLLANPKGFYAPLEPAIQWVRRDPRQLRASLLLSAAESCVAAGDAKRAAALLDDARATIGRRRMADGWIGARLNYLAASVAYQQRRVSEGDRALSAAMDYMRHGSLRVFQINVADELYMGGSETSGFTPRSAVNLFDVVLRDSQPADWAIDPMESLAVLVSPCPQAFEHWFEAAISRRDTQEVHRALLIADRARRHRFFTSLEFGGRLESLRWIFEAPSESLTKQARLQRQELLTRYPAYGELSRRAKQLRAALEKRSRTGGDSNLKEQIDGLNKLAEIGREQEAILREIALRREPADPVFPPLRTVEEVQKSLPPKHAAMVFFVADRHLHGFLLNNERCTHWQVASSSLLKQMQAMLREMGQYGPNHEIAAKDLAEVKWRKSARQVLDTLLKGSPADFSQAFDELVIVPDSALWYLPFEALQVMVDGEPKSLASRFRIRYAPTLSLCVPQGPGRSYAGNTAVVMGKLAARGEDATVGDVFDSLAAVVPGAVAIRPPLPAPSAVYRSLFQRLIVLDDIVVSDQEPYGWSPIPLDRGKPGNLLKDWLSLPWGGPDVIVLPGFHTAAEDAIKRTRRGTPGNDVFLSVCGLMASGARTLLIARWRTGGQTSVDLAREFVQELPNVSSSDAWQRAVQLTVDSRINFDAEPRVSRGKAEDSPKAGHPFFWAGYMLIDSSPPPPESAAKSDEPAAATKKPDKKSDASKTDSVEKSKPANKGKPAGKDRRVEPNSLRRRAGSPGSTNLDGANRERF